MQQAKSLHVLRGGESPLMFRSRHTPARISRTLVLNYQAFKLASKFIVNRSLTIC